MHLLKLSFFVLQCCGFWRPVEWSGLRKWLYNIYTAFMIFVIYSVVVLQFIELLNSINNVEEFTHNALILLTTTNACAKVFNILNSRNDILKLIGILETDPCSSRSEDERIIVEKFNRSIRFQNAYRPLTDGRSTEWTYRYGYTTNNQKLNNEKMSMWYAILTEIAVGAVEADSIIHDPPQRQLQFNTWLPYACDTEFKYWITYIHQVFANTLGSFINISYDTLVPGCMLQTCGQFSLFKYRIKQLQRMYENNEVNNNHVINRPSEENKIIADCVRHHLEIFNFAETSNDIFAYTIFIQYSVSLIILCVSVYELTRAEPFTPEFTAIIVYLVCMLVQIFMFCFYGNIVMHESISVRDDIYGINWVPLATSTKKSLVTIMARTLRPIVFTSGHMVVLSLDSFNRILKLSYSAYNVLQQAS